MHSNLCTVVRKHAHFLCGREPIPSHSVTCIPGPLLASAHVHRVSEDLTPALEPCEAAPHPHSAGTEIGNLVI